ncbi:3D domain-containing protein [Microbacteriaceae bacterium 4G12]
MIELLSIKRFVSIHMIFVLLITIGLGSATFFIYKQYMKEKASHQKVLQQNIRIKEQLQGIQEQNERVEFFIATTEHELGQTKQDLQQAQEKLQQTKQELDTAQQMIAETGVAFPFSISEDVRTLHVKATAYSADPAENGGTYNGKVLTKTGFSLTDNPNAKVIAVDPSVIPLGSTVWVEGYGYAKAVDTGGAIRGNRIDVFINNKQRMNDWGVKMIEVKVLNEA